MKSKKLFLLFLFCCSLGISYGQTRVAGTVVDTQGKPLEGATVSAKGSTASTKTDGKGTFSLSVPQGTKLLVFTFIGFKTHETAVKPTVRVTMEEDASTLGEVLVTAEFGMKRLARTLGTSAQKVTGEEIAESGRDNFISALQGRVSGLSVTSSGGAPGASTTVVLRNITSISGNNQPLYVVDGIPMNNSSYDPVGLPGSEKYSVRNTDYSSRGNDFNPEDIQEITVLKGAAAAALYGSDASNGAIIITTKKGRAGGGRVTYSNYFRADKAYGYPEAQTKYANGAYGTTNYYYTSNYGGLYPAGMKLYDNIAAVLQTGLMQKHNLSVEGGSDKATIRASFSQLDQTGVIKTTDYGRTSFSLAGSAKVSDWLKVESSMQYSNATNTKAPRGIEGPVYLAYLWPKVDDMSNYLDSSGVFMRNPDYYFDVDRLNPLFGLNKNRSYDKSDRFISQVSATITPTTNTFLRAQVGWDVGNAVYETSRHPYYAYNNNGDGDYYLTTNNYSDPTINILAGYNNKFLKDKMTFSAQVGYHQLENRVTRLGTSGSKFTVPDFTSINNVEPATVISNQRNTTRRIQAVSGQFEFGYDNIAFLTFRGRNDWSSTLPVQNNSYFYPAVEGSFVVSDLKFMKEVKAVNFLKLRGALAQVGKDAGPLEIDPQLQTTGLTGGGFTYGFTGPNRNLRPEMVTSKEIGFEARLLKNRINADFTYFDTHSADQIVKGFRLSYATGFVLNNLNVGTFDTWGWEGHIDGDVISTKRGLKWNVGFNASHVDSKVTYLPDNVTEYYNAYTWNSGNIRTAIMKGSPITTITGRAYDRNKAGDILISPTTGYPLIAPNWSILGDREPKLRFGMSTSVSYNAVRLSALFAGRFKTTVVNGTKRSMMGNGTSWESVDLRERAPVVFNGVLKDGNENSANPTRNNRAIDYSTSGAYGGGDEDWLEKNVNYLRLQELRLSYRIPTTLLAKTKVISSMDIYFVGNDLVTWTNYSGIDAVGNTVSAAAGGIGGEGYDVWALPNPRGLAVGLSITFK